MSFSKTLKAFASKKTPFLSSTYFRANPCRHYAKIAQMPEILAAPTLQTDAVLKLKTGQVFKGKSFGAESISVSGEAVFTTSLVGYPESMTDPSYYGQILVFTQPLIGNYGVPPKSIDNYGLFKHFESEKIHVKAIVVNDYATRYSHWNAVQSLGDWCRKENIPAISGVDTRAITQILRDNGSTPASVTIGNTEEQPFTDPNLMNLVDIVSVRSPVVYNKGGDVRIALVDCGAKQNIIRSLTRRGAEVVLLPWDYNYSKELDLYDGIFVSNGPGDPAKCIETVENLRYAFAHYEKPIFGICMGNLLMGLAAGMSSAKLQFGNRGHNQPAINLVTGQCVITSQNHGYALRDDIMPMNWQKYFVNANDGSNEGIRHMTKPFSSVQFHPEAMGGPQDTEPMFTQFVNEVREHKIAAKVSVGLEYFKKEIRLQQSL